MFVDDVALVDFEDDRKQLKQTDEIALRYTYDRIGKYLFSFNINKSVYLLIVSVRSQLFVGYNFYNT